MKKVQKSNRGLVTGILVVLVVGGLVMWSRSNIQSGSNAQPATVSSGTGTVGSLVTKETSYDFGTISMAAGDVKHAFTIKNEGLGPVVVEKIYTSCMCTTATFIKGKDRLGPFGMPGHGSIPKINQTIAPGEEVTIEATFDPKAHGPAGVGPIQRAVTLENNAGTPLEFEFTALVTP
ncbi:MAG: DUF1573 domain-containing protein [Parcubacteria group bacterium]|nr:DUF1573 domain-containing protein [Parcubacteria group bacterium]